jgi:hypothetical protein
LNSSNQPRLKAPFGWLILPFTLFVASGLIVVGLTSFIRLSGGARCLSNSLTHSIQSQQAGWSKMLEINVGRFTFGAARTALSFARLDPEVRTALRSVRSAQVGLYQLSSDADYLNLGTLLNAADQAMTRKGWTRLVGVSREHELVAVYVPVQQTDASDVQACVAVVNGRQLVVVGARSDLEPLVDLALKQANRVSSVHRGQSVSDSSNYGVRICRTFTGL